MSDAEEMESGIGRSVVTMQCDWWLCVFLFTTKNTKHAKKRLELAGKPRRLRWFWKV